ncbi:Bug family tripartite tricarboxylate transporter substrate binding protein [uncultured Enterovirga sp.]|uniref:Bug family tripartite tricarboxylate transporter substrate binding protein n=1 Tax=uncultured Enterovirga sp. TaxID=2026352 RepID=UPI0035CB2A6E
MPISRKFLSSLPLVLALCACSSSAVAQRYPSEPVRLVVGFAAGGSVDLIARIFADKVAETLGGPVLVVNQSGASGALAAETVMRSKPDGHMLFVSSASTLSVSPATVPNLRFNPQKDFTAIALIAMTPQVLAVHPSVNATSLKELLDLSAKSEVTIASAGIGGLSHLTIELLKAGRQTKLVHVPYRGGAPATTDAVAGHVNTIVMDFPAVQSFVNSGGLRALAVTSKDRSALLPDVPSAGEAGSAALSGAVNWFAIMAPAKMPTALADRLHRVFTDASNDPIVLRRLREAGVEPLTYNSRDEFSGFLKSEIDRWGKVAKDANITASP